MGAIIPLPSGPEDIHWAAAPRGSHDGVQVIDDGARSGSKLCGVVLKKTLAGITQASAFGI